MELLPASTLPARFPRRWPRAPSTLRSTMDQETQPLLNPQETQPLLALGLLFQGPFYWGPLLTEDSCTFSLHSENGGLLRSTLVRETQDFCKSQDLIWCPKNIMSTFGWVAFDYCLGNYLLLMHRNQHDLPNQDLPTVVIYIPCIVYLDLSDPPL